VRDLLAGIGVYGKIIKVYVRGIECDDVDWI
jgi:hypothetical protein